MELTIDLLETEVRDLLITGTTAKEAIYTDASNKAEADEVIIFVRELVERRIEIATKTKQKKFEADIAGRPRGKPNKWQRQPKKMNNFMNEKIIARIVRAALEKRN